MESENKILMTVDTGNSVKTISDLKKEITELKKALDQEAVGSEAAKKASDDLSNAQNQLKQALKGSTDVLNVANGSYKDLERQCEKLKLAYKSMADGIEKRKIGKQIANIQQNLKKQDAAIGDFKRNVGDYANAFGSALSSMGMQGGAAFTSMAKAGMGFKAVLDLLKAHPIIAIIAAVLLTIKAIVKAFQQNEAELNKLKQALAPFQGILNAFNTALGKLVGFIADGLVKAFQKVTDAAMTFFGWLENAARYLGMDKMADGVAKVVERMKDGTEITKEETALIEDQRKARLANADAETKIAKLQLEHKKAYGDTEKQAELTKKIEEERIGIAQRNYDLAKREYELKKKIDDQAPNSAKDNEELIASYEKMKQAEAALHDVSKEQVKEWKEEAAAVAEDNKELENNLKKRKELEKSLADWKEANSQTELAKLKTQYDKDLELLGDNEEAKKILTEKYEKDRMEIIDKIRQEQYNKDKGSIGRDAASDTMGENVQNNLNKAQLLEQKNTFEYHRLAEEEEMRHQNELLAIQIRAVEERKRVLEGIVNNEVKFNKLSEDERTRYIQELDLANQELNLLDSRRTLNEQIQSDKRKELSKAERDMRIQIGLDMANAVADIFSSIADGMDENNKKEFEAQKAFNIASATISTITGAIQAFMSAQNLPFPWGAIVGAIQAAAVTTAGIVNIAKISKQQFNGKSQLAGGFDGGASPSSSAINAINAPVQYSANVEGASLDEKISNTKVYVTETDIADTTKAVVTQTDENRY